MAGGRGGGQATVEEVEAREGAGGVCSPVVCILSICLCLVLAALVVVTALHTHTKLQAADDPASDFCSLGSTGLRAPCRLVQRRLNFSVEVGGDACKVSWFQYACPAPGSAKTAKVTDAQQLLLALGQGACKGGEAAVEAVTAGFFNVTDVASQLVKPSFGC